MLQEPGEIESEFSQIGTERVVKEFLTYRNPGPLFLPKGKGFEHPLVAPIVLPSWLSEEECQYYVSKYEKTGFTGGLNYYRNLDLYVLSHKSCTYFWRQKIGCFFYTSNV